MQEEHMSIVIVVLGELIEHYGLVGMSLRHHFICTPKDGGVAYAWKSILYPCATTKERVGRGRVEVEIDESEFDLLLAAVMTEGLVAACVEEMSKTFPLLAGYTVSHCVTKSAFVTGKHNVALDLIPKAPPLTSEPSEC